MAINNHNSDVGISENKYSMPIFAIRDGKKLGADNIRIYSNDSIKNIVVSNGKFVRDITNLGYNDIYLIQPYQNIMTVRQTNIGITLSKKHHHIIKRKRGRLPKILKDAIKQKEERMQKELKEGAAVKVTKPNKHSIDWYIAHKNELLTAQKNKEVAIAHYQKHKHDNNARRYLGEDEIVRESFMNQKYTGDHITYENSLR